MNQRVKIRPISTTRLIAAAAVILGLIFAVAFGTQVLQAIRLRYWRARLQSEVQQLERDKADWEQEAARRASSGWHAQELASSGWVRDDLVVITALTATPSATQEPGVAAETPATVSPPTDQAPAFFDNDNWYAWRRLLRGFD